jgi:4-hydroxybenzoate polyprenyltransferase
VDADWATARTLRVVANNLFGRQCSDMSTTFTARTRPRTRRGVRSLPALLGSHTSLAVVIVPLILTTLYRAWRGRFERHKKIARWTRPLWFYVSVTGVVVYWMLYHVYAQVPRVRVCATRQKLRSGCPFP